MSGLGRYPEHDRPCFMKACPFVAWGFDADSAKRALHDHIEREHADVAPELQKAGLWS